MLHLYFKALRGQTTPGYCSSSWPASAPFIGPLAFGPALASAEPRPGYWFGGLEEAWTVPLPTPQVSRTVNTLAQDKEAPGTG